MLVVNTNSTAMYANMHLGRANEHVKQSMQKLASGLRINSAKDDAAGLNIATQLNALERGLSVSIRNGQDALSIAQVAEGAMQEQTQMLLRMRDLALQAANGSNGEEQRLALDKEMQQIQQELTRIADTTTFGSQKILNGNFHEKPFQISTQANEELRIGLPSLSASSLGSAYHTIHTGKVKFESSDEINVIDNIDNKRTLEVQVDDNSYNIALEYADTATEIEDKINSINGLSDVKVEMIAGTGSVRTQEQSGLADIETYAGLILSVQDFANARAGETGEFIVRLDTESEGIKETTFTVDDSVTEESFKESLVEALSTIDPLIEAWVDQRAQGVGINFFRTISNMNDKLSFSFERKSASDATDTLAFTLTRDDEISNKMVFDSQKQSVSSEEVTEFKKGNPSINRELLSSQHDVRFQTGLRLDQGAATADAEGWVMQLQFSIEDQFGKHINTQTVDIVVDANNKNMFNNRSVFKSVIGQQLTKEDFSDWIDRGYIHDVASKAGSHNMALIQFDTDRDFLELGYQFKFQAQMIEQGNIATALDGMEINVYEQQYPFNTYAAQDAFISVDTMQWPAGHTLGSDLLSSDLSITSLKNFGEHVNRIRATSPNFASNAVDIIYNLHLTDGQGNKLQSTSSTTAFSTGANAWSGLAQHLYNVLQDHKMKAYMADIGLSTVYGPHFRGLDFIYEAKKEDAPTEINLIVEAALQTAPTAGQTAEIGLSVSNPSSTSHTLNFTDKAVGSVVNLNIPIGVKDTRHIPIESDRIVNAQFILDFSDMKVNEGIRQVTFTQEKSNLKTELSASDQVFFNAVSDSHIRDLDSTQRAIIAIDAGLNQITALRAELGALQNRVMHTVSNNTHIQIHVAEAKSRILDLDFAQESTKLAKEQVLQQTSSSMLIQANQSLEIALQLLQR